ncbi:unnamed protein product, partial [Gulo gulo]
KFTSISFSKSPKIILAENKPGSKTDLTSPSCSRMSLFRMKTFPMSCCFSSFTDPFSSLPLQPSTSRKALWSSSFWLWMGSKSNMGYVLYHRFSSVAFS